MDRHERPCKGAWPQPFSLQDRTPTPRASASGSTTRTDPQIISPHPLRNPTPPSHLTKIPLGAPHPWKNHALAPRPCADASRTRHTFPDRHCIPLIASQEHFSGSAKSGGSTIGWAAISFHTAESTSTLPQRRSKPAASSFGVVDDVGPTFARRVLSCGVLSTWTVEALANFLVVDPAGNRDGLATLSELHGASKSSLFHTPTLPRAVHPATLPVW